MSQRLPYVIAEISGNHLGELDNALELIHRAKQAGAQAVKFQHYTADTITANARTPDFQITEGIWADSYLWDLYSAASTPWEWTGELAAACAEAEIDWFSSPFDESAVDFLEDFEPSMYKIASFEIVDLPLIRYAAQTGRPLIISTGMASLEEIDKAVDAAMEAGAAELTLLRTNSGYPARVEEMNLAAIPEMIAQWNTEVGLSDHTLNNVAAIVATALGATVFEKHLCLDREKGGPDAKFSVNPTEMAEYINAIREARESLGQSRFGPTTGEQTSLRLRPSLRAIREIREGERFSPTNVQSIRPAGGLPPDEIDKVVGRYARKHFFPGEPITYTDI